MQFKHPEFLYALFALLIPILIHLFQLRRFQKVSFTNVQFLKAVTIQTRKSSQIKKWLTLLARLLALAALVVAFAQPFLADNEIIGKKNETVIYLDNSFSMQAKGAKGPLLQRGIQELLSNLPENEVVSIFTNTETFRGVTKNDIQNDLLQLQYTSNQIPYKAAYLKAKQLLGKSKETIKRIVLISDFQQKENAFIIPSDPSTNVDLVPLTPVSVQNISIDSLYLSRNTDNQLMLHVLLRNSEASVDNIPVALYDNEKLLAKTSVSISKNSSSTTQFRIEDDVKINGKVVIEDPALSFDNTRYFTINTPEKINVLAINQSKDSFIRKIFTPDEFLLISTTLESLNYNDINNANFIIINELDQIPISLKNTLSSFQKKGGSLCFIPSVNGDLLSYQQFISNFTQDNFLSKKSQEKKITTIVFSHPLYRGVFDKEVTNFQYPKVENYFETSSNKAILAFEDKTPFLYAPLDGLYIFTAALNNDNSNFKNSPIIVPTLYNMGKQSLKLSDISYTIGKTNSYDISVSLGQDGILSLESDKENVIPLQQSFANKVRITTDQVPSVAGIYSLKNNENTIQDISYNYDTKESNLQYYNLETTNNYNITDNITEFFTKVKEETTIQQLWKWFVIFALVFLLIEMLLLKYLP